MDEAAAAAGAEDEREPARALGKPRPSRGQLLPALIGLVGVLVGSLTTSGIAYLGARNSRHADERAATRLVVVEIEHDQLALRAVVTEGVLQPYTPLRTDTWGQQQATLARTLNTREWAAVSGFYADLGIVAQVIPSGRCAALGVRQGALHLIREGDAAIEDLGTQYTRSQRYVTPPTRAVVRRPGEKKGHAAALPSRQVFLPCGSAGPAPTPRKGRAEPPATAP